MSASNIGQQGRTAKPTCGIDEHYRGDSKTGPQHRAATSSSKIDRKIGRQHRLQHRPALLTGSNIDRQ